MDLKRETTRKTHRIVCVSPNKKAPILHRTKPKRPSAPPPSPLATWGSAIASIVRCPRTQKGRKNPRPRFGWLWTGSRSILRTFGLFASHWGVPATIVGLPKRVEPPDLAVADLHAEIQSSPRSAIGAFLLTGGVADGQASSKANDAQARFFHTTCNEPICSSSRSGTSSTHGCVLACGFFQGSSLVFKGIQMMETSHLESPMSTPILPFC